MARANASHEPQRPGSPPGGRTQADRILHGPIAPTLVALAAPTVAANLMQTAYEWINTFWVARLGADAVAAVAVAWPVVFLFFSLGAGFTIAGNTLVAQYTGAGDEAGAARAAGQTLLFGVGVAGVAGLAGFFAADPLLRLMGTPAAVFDAARVYLQSFFLGLGFVFAFLAFQAVLRGRGDTVTPMKLMALATVVNGALDPLLIFGWGPLPALGVVGAAYATVASRVLAAALGLWLLFGGRLGLRVTAADLRPDLALLRQVVAIGAPSAVEMSARAIGVSLMTGTVARFGAVALAAYGIASRIMSLVFLPSFAVAMAATTMVGQNVGARRFDRAAASGWQAAGLALAGLTAFGLLVAAWPAPLLRVFASDPELIREGAEFLRINGPSFGLLAAGIVLNGALRGAGAAAAAMVFAIVSGWVIRFPAAVVLAYPLGLGLAGVWWGMAATNAAALALSGLWFARGKWKRSLVDGRRPAPAGEEAVASAP